MPDYCWNTKWKSIAPHAKGYDFEVSWNLSMSEITDRMIRHWQVSDSEEVTNILCSTTGTSWSNAPSSMLLSQFGTALGDTYLPDTLVGFALNGVPFVQNLS